MRGIWLIGLWACGGDAAKDSVASVDSAPDTTEPEATCSEDTDCDDNEICENDACEVGDRNDDPTNPSPMFYETPEAGEINPSGDLDWYSIESSGGEFIQVGLIPNDEEGDLDSVVSVFDNTGHRIAWEDGYAGGNVSTYDSLVYAWLPTAGTYLIKVEDISTFYDDTPIGGENSGYTLEVAIIGDGVSEPDSLASAGEEEEIGGAGVFYTTPVILEEAGDTDYSRFDLPYNEAWFYFYLADHIETSDMDALVEIYNQDGDLVVQKANPTVDDRAIIPGYQGDRYIVAVSDVRGGGGPSYWGMGFTQIGDEGEIDPPEVEPDDSIETANVVDLYDQEPDSGSWDQGGGLGFIDTPEDVDLWSVEVGSNDSYVTIALVAQSYGGLLIGRIELLDEAGTVLDTVDSSYGSDEYAYNLGPYAAATYYVRISAAPDTMPAGGEGYFYRMIANVSSFTFDE